MHQCGLPKELAVELFKPLVMKRFFFSSGRRHTRLQGDWSSDVCSSDLNPVRLDFQASPPKLYTGGLIEHPFIRDLSSMDRGTTATLGQLASDLWALAQAGLASARTYTILPPAFRDWQEHGEVPPAVVDALLSADFGTLSLSKHLMIRAIVQVPVTGLDDKIKTERTYSALSNGIQRIYRSWGSSVARGNRA